MLRTILRRLRHPNTVSVDWLRDQDRKESRIGFEGVAWKFPVKKILNDSSLWNTNKLRRSA